MYLYVVYSLLVFSVHSEEAYVHGIASYCLQGILPKDGLTYVKRETNTVTKIERRRYYNVETRMFCHSSINSSSNLSTRFPGL